MAIGNTINTASRLEDRAKAGEVIISPAVYVHLKGWIVVTSLGPQRLKRIREPMELYRVDSYKPNFHFCFSIYTNFPIFLQNKQKFEKD